MGSAFGLRMLSARDDSSDGMCTASPAWAFLSVWSRRTVRSAPLPAAESSGSYRILATPSVSAVRICSSRACHTTCVTPAGRRARDDVVGWSATPSERTRASAATTFEDDDDAAVASTKSTVPSSVPQHTSRPSGENVTFAVAKARSALIGTSTSGAASFRASHSLTTPSSAREAMWVPSGENATPETTAPPALASVTRCAVLAHASGRA
mmetsp:Transcript_14904/g.59762  ORF Transcript_14904/g.59762 Transcript_14904/m.59762 type:complete len:210 (+) Transcript_14904:551-1180(+)